jgi:hypothetical protein
MTAGRADVEGGGRVASAGEAGNLSHPRRTLSSMEHPLGHFHCLWCACSFPRRYLVGRKPHYCSPTCRQRAYESRRRGARYAGHPRAVVVPPRHPRPARYEAGRNGGTRHALRPASLPDAWRRRQTLCGAWASYERTPWEDRSGRPGHQCRTCERLASLHPPPRPVEPAIDVAALTLLVGRLPSHPDHDDLFTYCGLAQAS